MAMRREDHPNDDTIEVRRGNGHGGVHGGEAPEQFVWHSRLWLVHEVQGHWTEAGGWGAEPGAARQREVWRVDAASGREGFHAGAGSGRRGVFDLVLDGGESGDSTWRLQAPADRRR